MAFTLRLAAHVNEGLPGKEHFSVVETPAPSSDDVPEGGILVQALVYSADPYQRSAIRSDSPRGKAIGDAMSGFLAGKVLASRSPAWVAGDLIGASLPLCSLQVVPAALLGATAAWKLTNHCDEAHIALGVGALGMPAATAWGGLIDVLVPKAGETLLVTAASGAVGALVCQIAKHRYGCRVIGTAGGPAKCAALVALGVDVAIDYKQHSDAASLAAAIKAAAGPKGTIDMVFENVGGFTFDAAFACLGPGGRIAVCGGIASYCNAKPILNSINPMQMIYTAQKIEGFVCTPWLIGGKGNFLADFSKWLKEGWLKTSETVFDGGLAAWPDAFRALFTGAHMGKVVVRA